MSAVATNERAMKHKARRVLRALNNMREGEWRSFMMSPQDRIDAAWLHHRYSELRGQMLFSEASMRAGTEFLLMVLGDDDHLLTAWAETHRFFWCDSCHGYRVGGEVPVSCGVCGRDLVLWTDLEMEWAEFRKDVMRDLYTGLIPFSSAWVQLRTDGETLMEWVLEAFWRGEIAIGLARQALRLDEAEIEWLVVEQHGSVREDDAAADRAIAYAASLPPITRAEAMEAVRRVARIEE